MAWQPIGGFFWQTISPSNGALHLPPPTELWSVFCTPGCFCRRLKREGFVAVDWSQSAGMHLSPSNTQINNQLLAQRGRQIGFSAPVKHYQCGAASISATDFLFIYYCNQYPLFAFPHDLGLKSFVRGESACLPKHVRFKRDSATWLSYLLTLSRLQKQSIYRVWSGFYAKKKKTTKKQAAF